MTKSKSADPAIVVEGLQLLWYIELRCANATWWTDPTALSSVVAALTATARWKELNVVGVKHQQGKPIGTPADVARLVAGPGIYRFARGEPRHATFGDETDAWLQVGIAQHVLKITSRLRGDVLERLGPAALDDLVDAIAKIRSDLDGRIWVLEMHARPTAEGELSYPHLVPEPLPEDTATPLDAVVDVVEQEPATEGMTEALTQTARLIADAKLPPDAKREKRGKLVAIRWVDDPSSPTEVCQAAARHEAWLMKLLSP